MRYELMLPHQIRKAIEENWQVVLPLGVLEYHGEHMAVGMETLAVIKPVELIEKERDIVILPPSNNVKYPFDHAGFGETSLMLALCPEAFDSGHFADNTGWYTKSAAEASA